ncbi:hypothetical protein AURDEDRAFT_160486 [Auricularia subglabra TFB-10046 SS5]|nr:hypothetical protein AURDEDRAFT_160486 [Auricularia subglabra TFB-10046 SS5]
MTLSAYPRVNSLSGTATGPSVLQGAVSVDLDLNVGVPPAVESQAEQTPGNEGLVPFADLVAGAELTFDLTTTSATISVQAVVTHAYRPFTMSPVVHVHLSQAQDATLPSEAILKFYDRRTLINIRENVRQPALWSPERESEYTQWLQDLADGRAQPIDFAEAVDESDWSLSDLSPGCLEGFMQWTAAGMHSREVHAYNVLAALQGDCVPRFYGTLTYRDSLTPAYAVPGILIEYIPGPTLRELIATWTVQTPRAELVRACEAAVDTIERVTQNDTLVNRDVRIDNVVFRGFDDAGARAPFVVIDFAACLPYDSRPLVDWLEWKKDIDEVGAIGQPLTIKVARQSSQE